MCLSWLLIILPLGLAPDASFDIPVRLVGWDEDFVWIVLPESREVDQKTVFVGHAELDLIDFEYRFERTSGHCVEGLLDGLAVVIGKGAEHCFANGFADKIEIQIGRG